MHTNWICTLIGKVVSTCSTDAIPVIQNLGSDVIVDYKSLDANSKLRALGGYNIEHRENKLFLHFLNVFSFDVILDCTGKWDGYDYDLLKSCANAKYLTLVPPILNNFNNYGVIGGILKTIYDLIAANILIIFKLKTLRWVLFSPNSSALRKLRDYAQNEKVEFFKLPEILF